MPDGGSGFQRLSPQQREARDAILNWYERGKRQVFHLAGLAGAGKTALAGALGREIDGVQYAAFTGKAASVLRQRGADNAVTLHSLLYGAPSVTKQGELVWRRRGGAPDASMIIADECSTIDGKLGRDLLKTGLPVLVTGDAFQLPPVCGVAFFGGEPNFTLTEIHRQAAGSQPLRLATAIREGERIEPEPFDLDAAADADVVICALNRTRRHLNRIIRRARGIAGKDPVPGDRIVCLRNNQASGVYNGTLWQIRTIERDDLLLRMALVDDLDAEAVVTAHDDGFFCTKLNLVDPEYRGLDLFDYGFALTAHKCQGSEWQRVVVIDETESPAFRMIAGDTPLGEFRRRWLYTATTRAKGNVAVMDAPR